MATAASPRPAPRHGLRLVLRTLLWLLLLLLVAAAALSIWFYATARAALPQLDGTVRMAGLAAPVTVARDDRGLPHITASSEADLFFAQGYVTAQDRMWQMDISRRFAAGEMSEVMGSSLLPHDQEQRILGVRQVAERSAAALSPDDRARWEAYVRGVNAYMEQQRDHLPIEFRVMRYQPRPWTVVDSFLCGANLAQALNHYVHLHVLAREAVTQKLGPELAADLYPNSSWRDHPPGQDETKLEDVGVPDNTRPPRHAKPARRPPPPAVADDRAAYEAAVPGSNNWVVSGAHTASGKPLLANDMHLFNTIPNTWYEAHLKIVPGGDAATFDVAGVTVPGMPFVIVGHNQRIAWGFTNLGPAVQDVFIENVNPAGQYQTPSGWRPLEHRREVIHVKGAPDIEVDVRSTRHGPLINELSPGEQRSLALRWTLLDGPMTAPFFDIDAAQNWEEFRRAFAQFSGPGQNVVYADVDGHIAYQATGRIPIRASGDGSLPVSGADDAHEWTGTVAFDDLPRVFDPPSGIIATANGRIVPDDYANTLSHEWGPPYRTQRIYRLLQAKPKLVPQDMLAIQTDIESEFDRICAQRFAYAVDHAPAASEKAKRAADLLRGWDGRMSVESPAPAIVSAAERRLWRALLLPRLGAPTPATAPLGTLRMSSGWLQYSWFMSTVALEDMLQRQPARWLPRENKSWDELLARAVEEAVTQEGVPRQLTDWRYGNDHTIALSHPIFGVVPLLRRWAGPGEWPLSGNGSTVKQVVRTLGPSQRIATDLAELDNSYLNIVTGQSGQIFSAHFLDQWRAYYEGSSFPLVFSDAAVKRAAVHTLTLAPRN